MRRVIAVTFLASIAIAIAIACARSQAPATPGPETVATASAGPSEAPTPTPRAAAPSDASAASTDAGAGPDRDAELMWARSVWPKELANVEIKPHLPELVAWVSPGTELEVWFTGEKQRCKRGVLVRDKDKDEDALDLKVFTAEKRANGKRVRTYTEGTAGHFLWFGGGGGDEYQAADGTWEAHGGWGVSDLPALGVLSKVEQNVARYDGTPVEISASCDGPMQKFMCPNGTSVDCDTCQKTAVTLKERPMGMLGLGRSGIAQPIGGCSCPDVKNRDVERANQLFLGLEAWTTVRPPGRARAAIYRTAAACKGDKAKP